MAVIDNITVDPLFDGELYCHQSQNGYRFTIDAVLLAHFVAIPKASKVLELGAGNGVIPLILAYRNPTLHITGLELQSTLYTLFEHNIAANSMQEQITALQGDLRAIRALVSAGCFDYVLANPPYRKLTSGRTNVGTEQTLARHETSAKLSDVLQAVRYALRVGGRAAFVYPAGRTAALLSSLKKERLEPKRMQMVYSYPDSAGKLVLVEAVKDGGEELTILPPFYIYQAAGGPYTVTMQALFAGNKNRKVHPVD